MSGHSKWHNIKHKKEIADSKRGKIFTRHAKLIAIAAGEGGSDPDTNSALRTAIANAKADSLPSANIEKAIKKGAGLDKEGISFSEVFYEGFAPGGVSLYIHVITDNKNRSITSVKTIMSKNGGTIGEAGSVSWMFEKKGQILAEASGKDLETAQLEAIDAGAEDLDLSEGEFEITTPYTDLMRVKENLEKAGFKVNKAEITYVPKNSVKIEDTETAKKLLNLIELLEEDDDVSEVYGNFEISDEIMEKAESN